MHTDNTTQKSKNTTYPLEKQNINEIAEDLFNKANKLLKKDSLREALKNFLNSLILNRNNPKAYLGVGLAYKGLKNYKKSLKALETASNLAPSDVQIISELAATNLLSGDYNEALKLYRKAIILNPGNYELQIQLATAHELADEPEMALLIYDNIIEKNPGFLNAYVQKATLYMSLEDYMSSAIVFREILKINPSYFRSYLGIGICYDKLNKRNEALRYYKKFLSLDTNNNNRFEVISRIETLMSNTVRKTCNLKVVN